MKNVFKMDSLQSSFKVSNLHYIFFVFWVEMRYLVEFLRYLGLRFCWSQLVGQGVNLCSMVALDLGSFRVTILLRDIVT